MSFFISVGVWILVSQVPLVSWATLKFSVDSIVRESLVSKDLDQLRALRTRLLDSKGLESLCYLEQKRSLVPVHCYPIVSNMPGGVEEDRVRSSLDRLCDSATRNLLNKDRIQAMIREPFISERCQKSLYLRLSQLHYMELK